MRRHQPARVLRPCFQLGHDLPMHFVRAIGPSQHACLGVKLRQREVIGEAGATVNLDRRIGQGK